MPTKKTRSQAQSEKTRSLCQNCRAYVAAMHWRIEKEVSHPGGYYLRVADGKNSVVITISSRGKVTLQGQDHELCQQLHHALMTTLPIEVPASRQQAKGRSKKTVSSPTNGTVARLLKQRHLTICHPRADLHPCVFQPQPATEQTLATFFLFFSEYAFRQVLFLFSSHLQCCREELIAVCSSEEQVEIYLDFLVQYGFIVPEEQCWRLSAGKKKSIGITLEWFIRELFQRRFRGVAQDGVYLVELGVEAGDLDVVAFLGQQHYIAIEAKASLVLSEPQLQRVIQRFQRCQADLCILYFDTYHSLVPVVSLLNHWLPVPLSWQDGCYGGWCGSGKIAVINADPTAERAFAAALQWDQ